VSRMSTIGRQNAILLAVVCIVIGLKATAFAVPPEQLFQSSNPFNLSGACCFSLNVGITATEPAKPIPVVVSWETFVFSPGPGVVGLMVNGGPCIAYGNGSISNVGGPRMFQWIVFPSDGLRPGSNTFTLCGGGTFGNQFMALTGMTIAARLSN